MTRLALLAALTLAASVVAGCGTTLVATTPRASTATARPTELPSVSAIASAGADVRLFGSTAATEVTAFGLKGWLDALAAISWTTGYRSVGSPGFDLAADVVADDLEGAGWQVHDDTFTTPAFVDLGGSVVVVDGRTFGLGDVAPLIFAPGGDVTGPIVAIEWDAPESTGKGCSAAGYGDLPAGAIVLVPAGVCFRRQQVLAAQEAGAAGFIAGYPAAEAGKVLRPTLLEPGGLAIPAAAATRPVGDALAAAAKAGRTIRLSTTATTRHADTRSIIADLPGRGDDSVVMLGAHLDSVVDGPGINDNGSGVAALLEIARALGGSRPRATIRLAFWSAEELGLHGSTHYVEGLSEAERDAIVLYLNADMVASPNGYAGVYDGADPPNSTAARDLLAAAITRAGGTPVLVDLGSGSDHFAFGQAGIPTGGVTSGAGELVSDAQAAAAGAIAGQPADPCYHHACDDGVEVDVDLARVLAAALADVALQVANDPTLVSP